MKRSRRLKVNYAKHILFVLLINVLVTGCMSMLSSGGESDNDSIFRNKALDYTRAKSVGRLEIPSELQATRLYNDLLEVPDVGTDPSQSGIGEAPRPEFVFADLGSSWAQVRGANRDKHLVIKGTTDQVWSQLNNFWQSRNQALSVQDKDLGVMETEWAPLRGIDTNTGLVSSFLRRVTGGDDEQAVSKVRTNITALDQKTSKVTLNYTQASHEQWAASVPADWQNPTKYLSEHTELVFELLHFFNQFRAAVHISDKSAKPLFYYGQTFDGFPVLRTDQSKQEALNTLLDATSGWDVGSYDADLGHIYLTHTSNQRASKPKNEATGFWGWFKNLHTKDNDSGPVVLSSSKDDEAVVNDIVYSRLGVAPTVSDNLADRKGHKIWIGGKVIFIFEDEDQGNVDESGQYIFTERYMLTLTSSLHSTYVQVFDSQGRRPANAHAEELLAALYEDMQ